VDALADIRARWYRHEEIAGVSFRLNDVVQVVSGEHVGMEAWVISVEGLEPEPSYLIELASGCGDLIVSQANLRLFNCAA
jgi:hypothetical protein